MPTLESHTKAVWPREATASGGKRGLSSPVHWGAEGAGHGGFKSSGSSRGRGSSRSSGSSPSNCACCSCGDGSALVAMGQVWEEGREGAESRPRNPTFTSKGSKGPSACTDKTTVGTTLDP